MKELTSYHHAWLSVHPERTEQWLREMFKQGFQVHHIDGDHLNDEPENLVLIEGADHLRLHRCGKLKPVKAIYHKPIKRPTRKQKARAELAEMKRRSTES